MTCSSWRRGAASVPVRGQGAASRLFNLEINGWTYRRVAPLAVH
jgi:hypothetical protein